MSTFQPRAPTIPGPHPDMRVPKLKLPQGACDCHAHVFGPQSRYPYLPHAGYIPPDAAPESFARMLKTIGCDRGVLVQPSVYGTDNTAMLDAMKTAPAKLRGVAVVAADVSDTELKRMHEAGVRGVRVNIVDVKDRKAGTLPLTALKKLAAKVRPFGWHMEFLMHVDEFPDLDQMLEDFPVPTVYGHFGYLKTDHGTGNPGFQALLRMMQAGRAWVKLTGPYRISAQPLPHADTNAYAHSLLRAAPSQVVWGSDWPHVMVKTAMPNDGDLADMLSTSIAEAALRKQVLVDNPARLYGFD